MRFYSLEDEYVFWKYRMTTAGELTEHAPITLAVISPVTDRWSLIEPTTSDNIFLGRR